MNLKAPFLLMIVVIAKCEVNAVHVNMCNSRDARELLFIAKNILYQAHFHALMGMDPTAACTKLVKHTSTQGCKNKEDVKAAANQIMSEVNTLLAHCNNIEPTLYSVVDNCVAGDFDLQKCLKDRHVKVATDMQINWHGIITSENDCLKGRNCTVEGSKDVVITEMYGLEKFGLTPKRDCPVCFITYRANDRYPVQNDMIRSKCFRTQVPSIFLLCVVVTLIFVPYFF